MNNRSYGIIITTVAIAIFMIFWTSIDGQLEALDIRLRTVEQQIAAISARLGIEKQGRTISQMGQRRHPAGRDLTDPGPEIGIIP